MSNAAAMLILLLLMGAGMGVCAAVEASRKRMDKRSDPSGLPISGAVEAIRKWMDKRNKRKQ